MLCVRVIMDLIIDFSRLQNINTNRLSIPQFSSVVSLVLKIISYISPMQLFY